MNREERIDQVSREHEVFILREKLIKRLLSKKALDMQVSDARSICSYAQLLLEKCVETQMFIDIYSD